MTMPRVVVVGGGIAGLSVAFTLQEDARRLGEPLSLTLLEAGPRVGGHAQTVATPDGFVVEAGPNGFLNREPHTLALIEALGLTDRLVEARPESARRFIVRGGQLREVPSGPASLVTTDALSWKAKLRLMAEPFAAGPPAGVDETVHAFATRRIGHEAAEMLVDAAVAGISAGDSRRLSVHAQFPMMTDMEREHGGLVRAMIARRGRGQGPSKLLSFDHGMGVLTEALAARLADAVRVTSPAQAIHRDGDGWQVTLGDGRSLQADHVVFSLPARVTADVVEHLDDLWAASLRTTEYAGLAVVALGYQNSELPRPLDGYGYLVTRPEQLSTLGVVWESSLFPGRAPDGHALLRVMLGGSRQPDIVDLPDARLLALARRELDRVMGLKAEPRMTRVFRWPAAIAQYTVGHLERRAHAMTRAARYPGLWLCGTSYDGVSFNHAVRSARLAARAVADALWEGAPTALHEVGAGASHH
jgi:protoporphyrinogen/coproporphyrinogen III oxidase